MAIVFPPIDTAPPEFTGTLPSETNLGDDDYLTRVYAVWDWLVNLVNWLKVFSTDLATFGTKTNEAIVIIEAIETDVTTIKTDVQTLKSDTITYTTAVKTETEALRDATVAYIDNNITNATMWTFTNVTTATHTIQNFEVVRVDPTASGIDVVLTLPVLTERGIVQIDYTDLTRTNTLTLTKDATHKILGLDEDGEFGINGSLKLIFDVVTKNWIKEK